MRLIDADALKEYCMNASKSDDDFRRVSLATLANVVDVQPTARLWRSWKIERASCWKHLKFQNQI